VTRRLFIAAGRQAGRRAGGEREGSGGKPGRDGTGRGRAGPTTAPCVSGWLAGWLGVGPGTHGSSLRPGGRITKSCFRSSVLYVKLFFSRNLYTRRVPAGPTGQWDRGALSSSRHVLVYGVYMVWMGVARGGSIVYILYYTIRVG
jgi:hypothetical protein